MEKIIQSAIEAELKLEELNSWWDPYELLHDLCELSNQIVYESNELVKTILAKKDELILQENNT